jgi:class 3 adenylate cyclase
MSAFSDELNGDVAETIRMAWKKRDGQVVPETTDLTLGNDRVAMEAVFLYADLADSTELAMANREIASEVCKGYLRGVTKIIHKNGGEIRSFDGDRVMGVFIEGGKNTAAANCGLQINWFFREVIIARFKAFYSTSLANFTLNQTVGIDRSDIHISRAGVRDNSDLIWVGRAPNIAAKLSGIRRGYYNTLITDTVYNAILDEAKYGGFPRQNLWDSLTWEDGETYGLGTIYGSTWQRNP